MPVCIVEHVTTVQVSSEPLPYGIPYGVPAEHAALVTPGTLFDAEAQQI